MAFVRRRERNGATRWYVIDKRTGQERACGVGEAGQARAAKWATRINEASIDFKFDSIARPGIERLIGDGSGWLYFISDESFVKIGFTEARPEVRLGQLQTSCPRKLTLLAAVRAEKRAERVAHRMFEPWRVTGEWFAATKQVLKIVDEIRSLEPPADTGGTGEGVAQCRR